MHIALMGGVTTVFEAEAKTLFASFTTPPTLTRKNSINNLIKATKADGTWALIDSLQVYCAADQQAALVDWKLTTRNATLSATPPTFAADRGLTTDGTASYVNTGFTPSTGAVASAMSGNIINGMFGVYERTNLASSQYHGGGPNTSNKIIRLSPRTGGGAIGLGFNRTTIVTSVANADSRGLVVAQVEADDSESVYKNGASLGSVASASGASAGLGTVPLYLGCWNNNGTPTFGRAVTVGAFVYGARLPSGNQATLYNALQAYMTDLGANV